MRQNAFGPRWAKKKRSSSEKVWGPGPAYASDKDYDEEDWTTHEGRNTILKINHELRGDIKLLDEESFPLVRVNSFAVHSLFRDIHNRLWTEDKHHYTSAQFLDCPDAGAKFERLTVTAGGAVIIGAMMDFVDGKGKNSSKFDGNQVQYKQGVKRVLMMEIGVDAILRATEGKDQPEQYLCHLSNACSSDVLRKSRNIAMSTTLALYQVSAKVCRAMRLCKPTTLAGTALPTATCMAHLTT